MPNLNRALRVLYYSRTIRTVVAITLAATTMSVSLLYTDYLAERYFSHTFSFLGAGVEYSGGERFLSLIGMPLVVMAAGALPALALGASILRSFVTSVLAYIPFVVLSNFFFAILFIPLPAYTLPAIVVTWSSVVGRSGFSSDNGTNAWERYRQSFIMAGATLVVLILGYYPISFLFREESTVTASVLTVFMSWAVLPLAAVLLLDNSQAEEL